MYHFNSIMATSPIPLTPPTSTPTYIFHFNLHFLSFKFIPQFPLLPLPCSYCSYHLSPYFLITAPCLIFFPVLWPSLINLPLPYHTILQTKPLHLSILCYINCSYFVVILQFVNCSQLLTVQAPPSVYSCDQLWLILKHLWSLLHSNF